VRAGATRDLLDAGIAERTPDGMLPSEQMAALRKRAGELLDDMSRCINEQILPSLREHDVSVQSFTEISADEQKRLGDYFRDRVAPLLTPLAIDPGHPSPFVANQALDIAVLVESARRRVHVVLLKVPRVLPR